MKFSMKDLFSKYDQIRRKLQIWSHLLKKPFMENFIFRAVFIVGWYAKFLQSSSALNQAPEHFGSFRCICYYWQIFTLLTDLYWQIFTLDCLPVETSQKTMWKLITCQSKFIEHVSTWYVTKWSFYFKRKS